MSSPGSPMQPAGGAKLSIMAAVIMAVAFALRLYSFLNTPIINSDGTFYIQQAKAIHLGLYDQVLSCYPYLSSYPVMITLVFPLVGDWVVAAKTVSLIFGTATLIPLYWILRRFFDETVSCLSLLVFAINPAFVELSREVIRGPMFWFFLMWGLHQFLIYLDRREYRSLTWCSVCFLLGAWTRTEGLLLLGVSFVYLAVTGPGGRLRRLVYFSMPPLVLTILVMVFLSLFHFQTGELFATRKITAKVSTVARSYVELREHLGELADRPPRGISSYFLKKAKNLVWLIALGSVVVEVTRAFFLPFFAVFAVGVKAGSENIRRDPRLMYLSVLSGAAFFLLYGQVLHDWAMFARFIAVFLFPAFVFVGFGVGEALRFLRNKFNASNAVAVGALCGLLLAAAVPKILIDRDRSDKVVLKEMGEYIAGAKRDNIPVSVGADFKEVRMVHFYAHVNDKGAPCFENEALFRNQGKKKDLRVGNSPVDYYIWNEKSGAEEQLEQLRKDATGAVTELRTWQSPKWGRLILFGVGS